MSDIGEKAFLRGILPTLSKADNFLNGFGNDASVVDIGLPDIAVAFKIDRAARPIAAYKGWTSFETWGRLAVTANLSDILAVGATPTGFMLSVTVPGDWDAADVQAVIAGAAAACEEKGVAFVGGDTKEGAEANVVGAAFGIVEKNKVVSRRSAAEGDVVLLAGRLGGFAASYLLRTKTGKADKEIQECLSFPECVWEEARYLFSHGGVTAAVDLSDGLAEGLELLGKDGLGVLIDVDRLPLHRLTAIASSELNIDFLNFAFTVGDWGMVFAMSTSDAEKAMSLLPAGLHIAEIGTVVKREDADYFSKQKDVKYELGCNLTNEHFRRRMESEGDYFSELTNSTILVRKIES